MESPPDPTSEPGKSASEAASAVRESPLNLDALRKAEHQAPVRRHSCSSTNRGSDVISQGAFLADLR
ncbi:nuclear receptor ROR-alpha isoform X1 [Clarias magur]|uniref:Nuclear receptor ROR-alpha isoform X1 n=1 Tax=Clarias magur TaxID=1594786 RepID=A0A8J4XCM6_CLAMG|nr:nuclear receptor ROR-alpha isoform X1 [Clarias magur]